tara:strand:+ start:378 stop:680 length:303 start_codon:yes stop_codon:yes gene_type:complete
MKISKTRLKEIIKEELGTVKEAGMRFAPGGNVDQSDLENKDDDDEPVMSWSQEENAAYVELRDAVKTWVSNAVDNGLDAASIRNAIADALSSLAGGEVVK